MTTTKTTPTFTPGPWFVYRWDKEHAIHAVEGGHWIANASAANEDFIVAAPEMYEELRTLAARLEKVNAELLEMARNYSRALHDLHRPHYGAGSDGFQRCDCARIVLDPHGPLLESER